MNDKTGHLKHRSKNAAKLLRWERTPDEMYGMPVIRYSIWDNTKGPTAAISFIVNPEMGRRTIAAFVRQERQWLKALVRAGPPERTLPAP